MGQGIEIDIWKQEEDVRTSGPEYSKVEQNIQTGSKRGQRKE